MADEFRQLWILRVDGEQDLLDLLPGWSARGVRLGQSLQDPQLWTASASDGAAEPRGGGGVRLVERRRLRVIADPGELPSAFAAVVRQRVESFERWRAVFEELEPLRTGAGILGVRVSQSASDPNEVHLYAFVTDPERYGALVRSSALLDRLKAGGLVGSPDVVLVRHVMPPAAALDPAGRTP